MGLCLTWLRFRLLLWKSWTYRRRNWVVTAVEISVLPLYVFFLTLCIRHPDQPLTPKPNISAAYNEAVMVKMLREYLVSETQTKKNVTIGYIPKTEEAKKIMYALRDEIGDPKYGGQDPFKQPNPVSILGYKDENEMGSTQKLLQLTEGLMVFGVVFNKLEGQKSVEYKLRFAPIPDEEEKNLFSPTPSGFNKPNPGPGRFLKNYLKFAPIQILLDRLIMKNVLLPKNGIKPFNHTISLQPFPYPRYSNLPKNWVFLLQMEIMLIPICFVVILISMVRGIVVEKESGFKALLVIMGMPNWMHTCAWFLTTYILGSISMGLCIIFHVVSLNPGSSPLLAHSSVTVLGLFGYVYVMQSLALCFLIASLFETAAHSIIFTACISTLVSFLPIMLGDGLRVLSFGAKNVLCILPNVAYNIVMNTIADFEREGTGAIWANIWETKHTEYNMSIGDALFVMAASSIVFFTLSFYLESVIPTKHGVSKPFYYPFLRSTWCTIKRKRVRMPSLAQILDQSEGAALVQVGKNFEEEPLGLEPGVAIVGINKVFGKKHPKVAVDNVSLNLFQGQCTVLLGHNGAGKTTLISILTGLEKPTKGTAIINGCDIKKDIEGVQKNLSLCPQMNQLLDEFTVADHLIFFARLKGMSWKEAKKAMKAQINALNMNEKENVMIKKLSGGQKRRVQLGMALIGGAKVVFLDEPTSGLDPEARREIWDLLLEVRRERTICLTTHFMEEADVLGDRIAIMEEGSIRCCGTPAFLKRYYGTGYTLHVTFPSIVSYVPSISKRSVIAEALQVKKASDAKPKKKKGSKSKEKDPIPVTPKTPIPATTAIDAKAVARGLLQQQASEVLKVVHGHLNGASFKRGQGQKTMAKGSAQVDIILPVSENEDITSKLPAMFRDLYDKQHSLNIEDIGLSVTTMDDVFSQVMVDRRAFEMQPQKAVLEIFRQPSKESKDGIETPTRTSAGGDIAFDMNSETASVKSDTESGTKLVAPAKSENKAWEPAEKVTGRTLTLKQFNALLIKKILSMWNNKPLLSAQLGIPIVLTMVVVYSLSINYLPHDSEPPAVIDFSEFPSSVTLFSSNDEELTTAFRQTIKAEHVQKVKGNMTDELLKVSENLYPFRRNYHVAHELRVYNTSTSTALENGTTFQINALYTSLEKHAAQLAINIASNTILNTVAPGKGFSIQVTNHPFAEIGKKEFQRIKQSEDKQLSPFLYFSYSTILILAMSVTHATFVILPLEEKLNKAKQLQLMTGVTPLDYWGSFLVLDLVVCFFVILVMIFSFFVLQGQLDFISYGGAGSMLLLWFIYSITEIFFFYVITLLFKSATMGFAISIIIQLLVVVLMAFASTIGKNVQKPALSWILTTILRIFPESTFASCQMLWLAISLSNNRCNLISKNALKTLCDPKLDLPQKYRTCCENCHTFKNATCFTPRKYLTWIVETDPPYQDVFGHEKIPGMTQELTVLVVVTVIYMSILIIVEYKIFLDRCSGKDKLVSNEGFRPIVGDEDVFAESRRVEHHVRTQSKASEDVMLTSGFCKKFGNFAAVSNVSFGVEAGECFGLLGVNGAGKTTMFRMLTGDLFPTSGDCFIWDSSEGVKMGLYKDRKKYLQSIGYCPQFDAFIGTLTGMQMLQLFARLRGVPGHAVNTEAYRWLKKLGLQKSANVMCYKYSGGMQRRLSVAMAMIGEPPVVLMDEPTSGVDPVSRRQFWKVMDTLETTGQAVILTSHSMDECEALCARLAIMVNGQLQCLGGVEHLKSKFAQGKSVEIKLKSTVDLVESPKVKELQDEILKKFEPCRLKERHQNYLYYSLLDGKMRLDEIFGIMEDLKEAEDSIVEEYSVSETTLEQVFLAFARAQYPERKVPGGCCKSCRKVKTVEGVE